MAIHVDGVEGVSPFRYAAAGREVLLLISTARTSWRAPLFSRMSSPVRTSRATVTAPRRVRRPVLLHLIEETVRQNRHLDILHETAAGVTEM
jgi:hypothetical protein